MTYVFDIDGTLCTLSGGVYEDAKPIIYRIAKVNELYGKGHRIILNTARGMGRTNNDPQAAEIMFKKLTEQQLKKWGVKYHALFFGKPRAAVYVDDRGMSDEDFFPET